ncbi:MAG: DUF922 domain-containing protein [Hyphomicrobiales bacterium]
MFNRNIRSSFKAAKSATIAVLASAIFIATLTTANADVLFNQEFKFFEIKGKKWQQIFKDFQKKSPIKAKGLHDATLGVAAIKLTPEVEYQIRGKRCHVKGARVTADVVIHLPNWVNYNKADQIDKLSWDKLFSDVKTHELQHAAIAKDYANRIQKKMKKQRSHTSCDKVEAALKKSTSKLQNKHERAQLKFDKREYGRLLKRK